MLLSSNAAGPGTSECRETHGEAAPRRPGDPTGGFLPHARMAEPADAADLKSAGYNGHEGSIPSLRTN